MKKPIVTMPTRMGVKTWISKISMFTSNSTLCEFSSQMACGIYTNNDWSNTKNFCQSNLGDLS